MSQSLSQSRSQGRWAPTLSGSQPAVARAEGLGSTSNSQHSIQDIENDIDAVIEEVDQLGKEFIASTEEYNSSLSKAKKNHKNDTSQIFMDYLAKMQDISMNSKPEDKKKEAYEELETAAQNKLDEIKERIDNRANEFGADGSDLTKRKAARAVMNRTKANTIRGKPEEIKKVADTPEGMREIEKCRARLADAYIRVESKLESSYEQYLTKIRELTEKQKKIKETLDEKNIRQVPEDRAEAARRVNSLGSLDPKVYKEDIQKKNAKDKRRELLEN